MVLGHLTDRSGKSLAANDKVIKQAVEDCLTHIVGHRVTTLHKTVRAACRCQDAVDYLNVQGSIRQCIYAEVEKAEHSGYL